VAFANSLLTILLKFLVLLAHLGKTEEEGKQIDADVAIYADGLGNWVRANDVWSFEVSILAYLHPWTSLLKRSS